MVAASPEEIDRIAALACLRLGRRENREMTKDISRILEYVAQLQEVDVEGISESSIAVDWAAPTRIPGALPDPLLRPPSDAAPDWREGFFVVPRLSALDRDEADGKE